MGLIYDIVNNVVPRVQERVATGEALKEVLYEELEKEIAQSLTDQSIENERTKIFNDIIADDEDIDNDQVIDKDSGEVKRDLI
jgi:hypothetical protein